jgi:O-antigen/teichoic acid export membrane protein
VVVPIGILIASSGGPLVHALYGSAWNLAAGPLLWLAPLAVLRVFYELANEYIVTLVSRRRRLALQLIWLVGLVPALATGARLDGMVGVAMWGVFGAAVMVCAWFLMGLSPITARLEFRASLLRVCLAAAVGVVAFGVLRAIDHDYTTLAAAGALTLLIVGFSVYRNRTFLHAVRRVTRPRAEAAGDPLRSAGGLVIEPPTRTALSVVPPTPGAHTLPPAEESLGSKVRKGARWSMLNAVVMRVTSSVVTAYLARTVFGPRIWGLYAVSQVVLVVLLSANELGICSAVIRWDGDVRNVARTVLTISVATSTIIYAALFVAAPEIARTLGSPGATSVVRVVCICVIIDGFAGAPSALIQREFQQRRQLICDSLNFLVSTGVMVALAFSGYGAMSFAVGAVAGSTVATVLYFALAPYLVLPGWNAALARRLLRFGLPLAGAALLTLGVFNVDSMIVGSTLGPVLLGLYALAFNISNWPANVIMTAMGRISFAGFSRVANSRQRLAESFTRALAVALAMAVPACVILGTLAEPFIRIV